MPGHTRERRTCHPAPRRPQREPGGPGGVERAAADLLRALGSDPDGPHLADTPRRVAAAYAELLSPRDFDLAKGQAAVSALVDVLEPRKNGTAERDDQGLLPTELVMRASTAPGPGWESQAEVE